MEILREHCDGQLSLLNEQIKIIPLTEEEKLHLDVFVNRKEHELYNKQIVKFQRDQLLLTDTACAREHPLSGNPDEEVLNHVTQTHAATSEAAALESFPPDTNQTVESSSHSTGNSNIIPVPEQNVESSSPIPCNSNVIDISKTLSRSDKNILERGLTFCPTNNRADEYELHKDLTEFARRMRLKEFFSENQDHNDGNEHALRAPSTWTPGAEESPELDLYIKSVTKEILTTTKKSNKRKNLTPSEEATLNNLAGRTDIIIKPADKGGSVVILPMEKYKDEAYRQLSNHSHYRPLDHDPSEEYSRTILHTLTDLLASESITTTDLNFMRPTNKQAGRFYLLPKIHKVPTELLFTADIPGRPIVSNNNTPTEALSVF